MHCGKEISEIHVVTTFREFVVEYGDRTRLCPSLFLQNLQQSIDSSALYHNPALLKADVMQGSQPWAIVCCANSTSESCTVKAFFTFILHSLNDMFCSTVNPKYLISVGCSQYLLKQFVRHHYCVSSFMYRHK